MPRRSSSLGNRSALALDPAPHHPPAVVVLRCNAPADVVRMAIQFFVLHEAERPFTDGIEKVSPGPIGVGVECWAVAVTMLASIERKSPPIRWPLVMLRRRR